MTVGLRSALRKAVIAVQIGLFAGLASQAAAAPRPTGDWMGQRRVAFARWQAEHPNVARDIIEMKRETAVRLEEHRRPVRREPSAAQRQAAAAVLKQAADLAASGDCERAAPPLRRAAEIDAASGPVAVRVADCFRRKGRLAEAAEFFSLSTTVPVLNPEIEAARMRAMFELQTLPPPRDPRIDQPSVIFRTPNAPAALWDAPEAPPMTIIPAGEFTMGSPPTERYRLPSEGQHRVTVGYPLAVSTYNVTRAEFAAFVAATGYRAGDGSGCSVFVDRTFKRNPAADWRTPGFVQSDDDPVVCVNFHDAEAYADWLSQKTGHRYRIPSEAEWEYATRAGTSSAYYWGEEVGEGHANCDGCAGRPTPAKTTPGGTFAPNAFGLYDVSGDVWKWLADCWNPGYDGAPADGSAWMSGNCALRVRRSGSWFNLTAPRPGDPREPGRLRAASRFGSIPDLRYSSFGFRVVRDL